MEFVLVVDSPKEIKELYSNYTEGYNEKELEVLIKTLKQFGGVTVYTDLKKFSEDASVLKDKIIFPMFWGKSSRTIKGHAASICEIHSLNYMGSDSYVSVIANDKFMVKRIINEFGLKTAPSVLIYDMQDENSILKKIDLLNFPVVIKPNFGGGSTGITKFNLVDTLEEARQIIKKMFQKGFSPLIVEEYIEGYEISLLFIGNSQKINFLGQTMLNVNDKEYFKHFIWSVEDKKIDFSKSTYKCANVLPKEIINKSIDLFKYFEKAEYLRIDGRFNGKDFYVLEIAPDCYLGPNSDFHTVFKKNGKTYSDFIRFLITNHLESNNNGTPQ